MSAPESVEALRVAVEDGSVDTVVLALVDLQGRLQGKRLDARYFLDDVLEHGSEGCNYLLAVDVEMNTVDGYQISSWQRGYGDFVMVPDLDTLRPIPWQPGSMLVLADVGWLDGSPVPQSPRQILRRQLDRLAERGWQAFVGTELEFIVFQDSYEQAWSQPLRRPDPGQPVQRGLLDPRHQPGGAAAARDPAGHARCRPAGRVGQGRVQPGPARDRLQVRRGAAAPATTT